jgi:putative endopeptidase
MPRSSFTTENFSDSIRPQDDLFRFVNQPWADTTPIPADRSAYGSLFVLDENAQIAIRAILEQATTADSGTELRQIGDLYTSFLDVGAAERRAAAPLVPLLELIDQAQTVQDVVQLIGDFTRRGLAGFLMVFVDVDRGRPDQYIPYLEQAGLSLPDESNYRDEDSASMREAFLAHVERLLALALPGDAAARARNVLALETAIAAGHWDQVACRDEMKSYNPQSWTDVGRLVSSEPALEWWASGLGVSGHWPEVVVRQPSFISTLGSLFNDERLEQWRDWLRYQAVSSLAPYLSTAFVAEHFEFYGRTLTGQPEIRERWKRGVGLVEGAMGEAVGRVYVAQHFPPSAKDAMDALVANLLGAYRESISELPWMSDVTRQRALEKLAAFTPKIGYPPRWRDYGSLVIDPQDLCGNVIRAHEFEFERHQNKLGRPIDRDEWLMTPQTVNAYYNPTLNEIVFPAAILQPPYFDADRDAAENYGAIGAIIGHEIGHGFDDQGSKFDGTGKLQDWWRPEDREAFDVLAGKLIQQYNQLTPAEVPDGHVNGALTIGENIGDLGGLGIALKAYRRSLGSGPAPEINGLSGEQRFFLAWALGWRYAVRPEEARRLLTIDPHSPPQFRCNQIVRNLGAFYEAFSVSADDELWLDAAERVEIW